MAFALEILHSHQPHRCLHCTAFRSEETFPCVSGSVQELGSLSEERSLGRSAVCTAEWLALTSGARLELRKGASLSKCRAALTGTQRASRTRWPEVTWRGRDHSRSKDQGVVSGEKQLGSTAGSGRGVDAAYAFSLTQPAGDSIPKGTPKTSMGASSPAWDPRSLLGVLGLGGSSSLVTILL